MSILTKIKNTILGKKEKKDPIYCTYQDKYRDDFDEEEAIRIGLAMVTKHGTDLSYLRFQNHEICLAAVKNEAYAIHSVKTQFYTDELWLEVVKQDAMLLHVLQRSHQCSPILKDMYTPSNLIYEIAVQKNGLSLQFIPEKDRTYKIKTLAVQQNGHAILYINPKERDLDLYDAAILSTPDVILELC